MADALKSYVEKYLLNPAASFNVDEDGNQETKAQVVDIAEDERIDASQLSVSKLRARNAALQAETDPRYKGKKIFRGDLKKNDEIEYDPNLAKYFSIEDDDDDEENIDGEEEKEENDMESEEESSMESDNVDEDERESLPNQNMDDDNNYDTGDERTIKKIQRMQNEPDGFTFVDDGNFSKFADDFEDESGEDSDDEETEKEIEMGDRKENLLKKFSTADQTEEVKKGQAVKNQLAIYDSLFEGRISLQKVVIGANQLPQFNTYKLFLKENDPNYIKNLIASKTAAKKLLTTLLHVQTLLLKQNPETRHIITGKKLRPEATESDEEIPSSEEENDDYAEESALSTHGIKRKMKMEEYEEVIRKRHASVLPFRDQSLNKWYEKTKLLSSRNSRDKFSGFEVSAVQQLNNILANKQQLIRRTQLTGTTRGTSYHILGQSDDLTEESFTEEYNPEIFDDTDFYTRALEEILKAKVTLSSNMTDVSRKWIDIQNLRRKAKRVVDKRASKGRKLRYEVMSKLQQYLAPCHPPRMDDAATNTLFASLFGKSVQLA